MTIRDEDGFDLINFDPETGRSVWSYFDGEKTVIKTTYAADQTVEDNTAYRNTVRPDWAGDWHRVASIPLNIVHDSGLVEAVTQNDEAFLSRWLNDAGHRAWRTKGGQV